jgi:hypothetical protein
MTLTLTHLYLLPDLMILLVLLLIILTLDTHSNSFVSTTGPNDFTSLTVNHPLVKSLGPVVDTNELE